MGVWYLFYNLISSIVLVLIIPIHWVRRLAGDKYMFSIPRPHDVKDADTIWVTAAAAGEVLIAKIMIDSFSGKHPEWRWLIITTTNSGFKMAGKTFSNRVSVAIIHADHPLLVRLLEKRFRPVHLIMIENWLWPNFVGRMKKRGIKVVVVNGRLSDNAIRRRRFFLPLFQDTAVKIDRFYLQSRSAMDKLTMFGVEPSRLFLFGNMKFDQEPVCPSQERLKTLYERLGLHDDNRLIVAGSTHEGEEIIILESFFAVRQRHKNSVLVLAPRQLQRIPEIIKLLDKYGEKFDCFSKLDGVRSGSIILVDTFGDLSTLYGLAFLSIVGGSFVGNIGGHNLLEPISQGSPVFFGPYAYNFSAIQEILIQAGVGVALSDSTSLVEGCLNLLAKPDQRDRIGQRGIQLIREHKGVTSKIVNSIEDWLDMPDINSAVK